MFSPTTKSLLAALSLSSLTLPASSAGRDEPRDTAAAVASANILSAKLEKDLGVIGQKTAGQFTISDERVAEIKAELSKITNLPVDRILTLSGSSIVHNVEKQRDEVAFVSGSTEHALVLSGPAKGTIEVSDKPFAETHKAISPSVDVEAGPVVSMSQSQKVWLKVFEAANAALKGETPSFTGEWKLREDPLKIEAKLATASSHLRGVEGIDGYTLASTAGFGDAGVARVNALFAEHKLESRFEKQGPAYTGLVAGAVEEISFPFVKAGRLTTMEIAGTRYESVVKTDQKFHSAPTLSEPVVELPTSNGVAVLLFKASALPGLSAENVLTRSQEVVDALQPNHAAHATYRAGVQFPKVAFSSKTEPSWLLGSAATGTEHVIDKTVLETKFTIDENGGASTTGAGFGTPRSISRPKIYYFNEPFVVVTVDKANRSSILNATVVGLDAFVKPN